MAAVAGLGLLDLVLPLGHGDVFELVLARLRLQDLLVLNPKPAAGRDSLASVQALLLSCKQLCSAVAGAPQKTWRSAGEH